jgi:hypothetical protein
MIRHPAQESQEEIEVILTRKHRPRQRAIAALRLPPYLTVRWSIVLAIAAALGFVATWNWITPNSSRGAQAMASTDITAIDGDTIHFGGVVIDQSRQPNALLCQHPHRRVSWGRHQGTALLKQVVRNQLY